MVKNKYEFIGRAMSQVYHLLVKIVLNDFCILLPDKK